MHPPIHLETVGGQSGVQTIAHITILRAAVYVADRAKLCNIEIRVAAEQRIIRPRDVIDTLVTYHLPLSAFQREADAGIAILWVDAHHVRTMLRARTIGGEFYAGEAKDKTDQLAVHERAGDQSTVMDGSDQHVGRHNIRFAAWPDDALKLFDGGHVFRRFKDFDNGSRHILT
jgi:hypothetical protein